MILALLLIIKTVYDIIKNKSKKRLLLRSVIILILIGICVWYFFPTHYQLPDIDAFTVEVYVHANKTGMMEVSDMNQKQQIYNLVSGLSVRRPFFYSFGTTTGGGDFAVLFLGGKTPEQYNDFHLELMLSLNNVGLYGKDIYCRDFQNSIVLNPQKLISYIEGSFVSAQ